MEHLIEIEGFSLRRLEPRFTPEKIEFFGKVDKGEVFAPALSDEDMVQLIRNEVACLREIEPVCVVTGSYMTIPVTARGRGRHAARAGRQHGCPGTQGPRDPDPKIEEAPQASAGGNRAAKEKARKFSGIVAKWDGPKEAAALLYDKFGRA